jgi:hypothetical protein
MNNLLKLIPIIFLVGCGSSSNVVEEDTPTTPPTTQPKEIYEVSMELYKSYVVTVGDKVIKKSEDAHIKVVHIEGDINSTVELIGGEANLIYLTPIIVENNSTEDNNDTDKNTIFKTRVNNADII